MCCVQAERVFPASDSEEGEEGGSRCPRQLGLDDGSDTWRSERHFVLDQERCARHARHSFSSSIVAQLTAGPTYRLADFTESVGGVEDGEDGIMILAESLKPVYKSLAWRQTERPPPWAPHLPPDTLSPANFVPDLQLVTNREPEAKEPLQFDQLFSLIRTNEGGVHEAPRRVLVEGGPASGKTSLALRVLHCWATDQDLFESCIQLVVFVPLRELKGASIAQYLSKELMPKGVNCNNFLQVWKNLQLLEDRLLFVLDGYDEAIRFSSLDGSRLPTNGVNNGKDALGDALELLEGRLFPECRILLTCSPGWSDEVASYVHRKVLLQGLEWSQVKTLIATYFLTNKQDYANRLLDTISSSPTLLKPLAAWPLGWLLLCVLYEEDCCYVPMDSLDLYQALFKCLIRRSLVKRGEIMTSTNSSDLPGHCKKLLAEFGKLALACIKEDRFLYTDIEIRIHCRTGGLEITELGFLIRGLHFGKCQSQKKKPDYYTPIHRSFAEFLAAYYISSVVHYSNILRRELEELPGFNTGGQMNMGPSTVLILKFLMGLLGRKGHLVFNQFCPLDLPTRTLFILLQAAGSSEGNVSSVGRLLGASNGNWMVGQGVGRSCHKIPVQLIHTAPIELEGWSSILKSDSCTLEALELVFQFDKGEDCEEMLDVFFSSLAVNDSVRLMKISSLLGHEFTLSEMERLAKYIKTTLKKPRLHTFELVITCLDDTAHDRFQCLVEALSESLEEMCNPTLNKLVLDINLGTEQVQHVCRALELASNVTVLHLPHLGCGREGLRAVADLIRSRPLVALNLAGSWGTRPEDQPSSSGASLGSGSGSSGGASCSVGTIGGKSLLSSVSPKTNCSYYFSSLPRGALGAYRSITRPATLPRQPLHQIVLDGYGTTDPKRNSDSILFQRLFHPMPSCDPNFHSSGFHDIFEAIRDPLCKLRSLNVSKCLLAAEDALCLGETVRKSRCLDALRLEGGTRLAEVLPVLLGLAENTSLQLLDLGSQRLTLEDGPTQLVCQALDKNSSLRLLSLEGWSFKIEEEGSLAVFLAFLQSTSVRDLVLANCRLHLAIHDGRLSRLGRQDDSVAELLTVLPNFVCPGIIFLRLGGFQVTINDRLALQGPHLLPFLRGFTRLSDLDLSLDKGMNSDANPFVIDDKTLINFFQTLSLHFRTLQSLKIANWKICLDDYERTLRVIGRCLKTCSLSYLKVNGIIVTDTMHRTGIEHMFLQTATTNLNYLSWISIVAVSLSPIQTTGLGKCIRERFPGSVLEISAKDIGAEATKSLVAALEEGGKTEVTFLGGPSFNLKMTRLLKNQKLKGKFRRFTSLKE